MELEILEKKIRRLVAKLKKHNIDLEVFDHSDIKYGSLLGKGGEGVVQKCTITYNDLPVDAAVKTVTDSSDDAISITLDEIELLCLGADPVVNTTLKVYGVAAVPDEQDPNVGHLVILTEAGLMNALQLYQEEDVPIEVTLELWSRVAAAVHCLHTKKILHQDLKPENILITSIARDSSGVIQRVDFRIIDFGMGKRVYSEKVVTEDILGTNGYHPPEVLFEESYDFRADVFMLGITFCVLLHGPHFLKKEGNLQTLLKDIHNAKKKKLTGKPLFDQVLQPSIFEYGTHDIPAPIKSLLCSMLEKQYRRKISLVEVVQRCRAESDNMKQHHVIHPPAFSPACVSCHVSLSCISCLDSGFGSGKDGSRPSSVASSRSRRSVQSVEISPYERRLRSRASDTATYALRCRKRKNSNNSNDHFAEPVQTNKRPRRATTSHLAT